jgi:hypothetical protein
MTQQKLTATYCNNLVDDSDSGLNAKCAMTGHMILASDDRHFVLAAERRDVDDQLLDQDLLIFAVAALENHSPLPFAAGRLVGHRVVSVSDEFAHDRRFDQVRATGGGRRALCHPSLNTIDQGTHGGRKASDDAFLP